MMNILEYKRVFEFNGFEFRVPGLTRHKRKESRQIDEEIPKLTTTCFEAGDTFSVHFPSGIFFDIHSSNFQGI